MRARIGLMLPTFDPLGRGHADMADWCRRAEDAGFDGLWVGDHLAFNSPILDSGLVLATAAAVTSRPQIGYSVMLLAMRNPAWAAKQIATLQHLSGNRLVLGVGVGGENAAEWHASGVDPRRRGALTDEMLAALPDLLSGKQMIVAGRETPPLLPIAPMPDVWVGGRSDAALRRAVRFGQTWLGAFLDPPKVAVVREKLAVLAAESHRATPTLAMTVFVNVNDDRNAGVAESEAYLLAQYRAGWSTMSRYCAVGSTREVAESLANYAAAGVEDFVLMPISADADRQRDRLVEVRRLVQSGLAHEEPSRCRASTPFEL